MFILVLGAIGYISAGFTGVAIAILIGVAAEFVWKLIE
jgi:hypothetical protein